MSKIIVAHVSCEQVTKAAKCEVGHHNRGLCLIVLGVDDFLVRAGREGMIHLEVHELGKHTNRAIGKNELGTTGMKTSEIFKVSNGTVGRVVGGTNDPRGCSVRIMYEAVPD